MEILKKRERNKNSYQSSKWSSRNIYSSFSFDKDNLILHDLFNVITKIISKRQVFRMLKFGTK